MKVIFRSLVFLVLLAIDSIVYFGTLFQVESDLSGRYDRWTRKRDRDRAEKERIRKILK